MKLADAQSKEQVQQALDDGDEELREDIEDQLDEARRRWERSDGYSDDSDVDPTHVDFLRDHVADNEAFVDAVIEASNGDKYDLSVIPRESVHENIRWTATHPHTYLRRVMWGPFRIDRGDMHIWSLPTSVSIFFPEDLLPENADMIPEGIAAEFWSNLGYGKWEVTTRVIEQHGWSEVEPISITAERDDFKEWCRDTISEYVDHQIRVSPAEAKRTFFESLAKYNQKLADDLRAASVPDEELLSLAHSWFTDEHEDTLETIQEYLASLSDTSSENEIIATYDKDEIRAMGITRGVLLEEAPWSLIKLRPSDLRLEGAIMRHCVGDVGMGYVKALREGEVQIWSLRDRRNKPHFTLEVDGSFDDRTDDDPLLLTLTPAFYRGRAIKQIKGKANRLPGLAGKQSSEITKPDEVIIWAHVLEDLDVDIHQVDDLNSQYVAPLARNAREESCSGFDLPYRPLRY
jgi:hypothetical protein